MAVTLTERGVIRELGKGCWGLVVRYCATWPGLKLNISTLLGSLECGRELEAAAAAASAQCLVGVSVTELVLEPFDPRLLRSDRLEVSEDSDCFILRFCASLLDAEDTGVRRKPSRVTLWKAS